ncbi:hydroxyisourate hydrolase [Allochromatium vinosum]|uniref:hydroxyisourate hydrolase n=1 Tax=Allochromatium vinosum TaxID=1049 RepID=UPI001907B850|nr:hydroxyisourate hydrolase [Allochromatium vinosum]MBK1655395.1 hydroxyisourate hydrolase [Allochromatium vinosum]
MLNKILFVLAMQSAMSSAIAAGNPLSVHVLNMQDGLPGPNVEVTLERMEGREWQFLRAARTDEQGRIRDLHPEDAPLQAGVYRVIFKTGDWLKQKGTASFFPEIPVVFRVDGTLDHYHIPLLLSPYGYSTYRGN